MRATFLVAIAQAAVLAALLVCAAEGRDCLDAEDTRGCCAAKVTDLESHVTVLSAENIALRKVIERQASEIDECRAESIKQPPRLIMAKPSDNLRTATTHEDVPTSPFTRGSAPRRRTLATPAPTPLTPIPTPFTPIPTTATPSATPTASPVPTTEGVTTHSQLAAAVADSANTVVVVEADVTFPLFSAISVGAGRSVSVVGRSAVDGGRVVFDGDGHSQHFWVAGGTLHISLVDLVNGTASQTDSNCRPDLWKCTGGSILVTGGGELVMRSCDVRGGPGVNTHFGNAYMAAGVFVYDDDSTGDFYNVSFSQLRATYHSALFAQGGDEEEHAVKVRFFGCVFSRNSAVMGSVTIGWVYVQSEFYDCLFEKNDGVALMMLWSGDSQLVRCTFRENTGADDGWQGYGSAVILQPMSSKQVVISDSVFERNTGAAGGSSGGALTVMAGSILLSAVSFLANTALSTAGGAALDVQSGSKVTAIDCFALANVGAGNRAGGFNVMDSELTVINSECREPFCQRRLVISSHFFQLF